MLSRGGAAVLGDLVRRIACTVLVAGAVGLARSFCHASMKACGDGKDDERRGEMHGGIHWERSQGAEACRERQDSEGEWNMYLVQGLVEKDGALEKREVWSREYRWRGYLCFTEQSPCALKLVPKSHLRDCT